MVQQEFENIAVDLRHRVIAVAGGYGLDADSVEDVAQDTMLKLWNIRERVENGKSAMALAVTIARHLAIDMLRGRRTVDIDKVVVADSRFNEPDSLLESSDDARWITEQFDHLPTKEYAVLQLRQVEHRSAREIAAIVGVSEKSVPTMLARARRKLLEEMKRRES